MPRTKDEILSKAHMQEWGRFLASEAGTRGMLYMRMACPRLDPATDDALIRNSVGFEFWQKALDRIEQISEIPPRPIRDEIEPLET
jgi:hypothetical protein